MEYASKAVGTAGLTTGIIGTALGALGGGLSMFNNGRNGWGWNNNGCGNDFGGYGRYNGYFRGAGDEFITRYEAEMQHQLSAKDGEIALLKSEQFTEEKIADVYERIMTRVNADKAAQNEINTAQAVYNGTNTATLGCMRHQIDELMGLTALRIPNRSVCPGWGDVNVVPVTPTATTPATT